ncbi:uncharacterized protein LOC133493579 [Syngnathoides biaculeatus]|uniref:uncharacterized protein LOC133493579 n=1 Tax=Syngnathoides biaculeatus TaxID=300417 RepID=UPI002ADDFD13|nr:uncharacterized protein LOC133493579 [Syngnathoides biaculeatus]
MNYVLFCHQKTPVKQQVQDDNNGVKMKRSCLRANRRGSAREKETVDAPTLAAEVEPESDAAETRAESPRLFSPDECKPLVASLKSRQRAARLAHVKEIFSQSWGQASPRDPMSTLQPSGEFLLQRQRKQVLTYHQIPLITLDWDNDKQQQWVSSNVENIWTGRAKVSLSKASEETVKGALSVNEIWGTFLNGKSPSPENVSSVCDVWQAFIHGPRYEDNCGIPESEWPQKAASVPPTSEMPGNAPPATSPASAVGQAPSHASPAHVSSRAEEKRAERSRVAAALAECGSAGAPLESCASVDNLSERHEREEERMKGGIQGYEAGATSQRVPTTTDMTAEAENASHDGDGISREDTGGEHNATDDLVAFWDTVGHGAKDAAGRGAEGGIGTDCTRAVTFTEEDKVKPREKKPSANQTEDSSVETNESGRTETADEFEPNETGSDMGAILRENNEGLKDQSGTKVFDNLYPDKDHQKQGYRSTLENISVEFWNQPESSERGQDEQRSLDVVNVPLVGDSEVNEARLRSTKAEPVVAETLAVIESRSDGGQIRDDLVRRVRGQAGNDPPRGDKIPGQSTCSPARGSGGFLWWSVLYILSHVARIVTCSLLVAGFVVVAVLYEFPAFFVVYMFPMAWWFYKWWSPRVTTNKAIGS